MSVESRPNSGDELGSLQGCLVGGDPEQRERERRVRRKSLILSVIFQGLVCTAILLLPLFAKPARLAPKDFVPVPPYYAHRQLHATEERTTVRRTRTVDADYFRYHGIPQHTVSHTPPTGGDPVSPGFLNPPIGFGESDGI